MVTTGMSQHKPREILPARARLSEYYPLSLGRTMVGVLMLRGECAAAEMNLHESIVNELVLSLETIRQRQRQNRLTEKLNDLYVTDQLTGLNNRFGIARFGRPLFDRLTESGQAVRFLFLDIDDMKGINDRHGHDGGDAAIRAAAEVLRRISRPGDYLMRYGGDEFIAIGPVGEEIPAGRVREELERICGEWKLPFRLGLSMGMYIREPDSGMDLDACLQAADLKMYEAKKKKKTGENSLRG